MFVRPESPIPLLKQTGSRPSPDSTGELRVCRHHGLVIFHLCGAGKWLPLALQTLRR
jgi:hypothetical protein